MEVGLATTARNRRTLHHHRQTSTWVGRWVRALVGVGATQYRIPGQGSAFFPSTASQNGSSLVPDRRRADEDGGWSRALSALPPSPQGSFDSLLVNHPSRSN